jgi:hypothetical protein
VHVAQDKGIVDRAIGVQVGRIVGGGDVGKHALAVGLGLGRDLFGLFGLGGRLGGDLLLNDHGLHDGHFLALDLHDLGHLNLDRLDDGLGRQWRGLGAGSQN